MQSEIFNLDYKDEVLKAERIDLSGQAFFRITFPGKEQTLTILRAKHFNGNKFWTSMPEGKQKLAEEIGILIEQHYRSKN